MTLPRESLDFDSWNDSPAWIDEKTALPQMAGIPREGRATKCVVICLVNPSRFPMTGIQTRGHESMAIKDWEN